MGTRTADLGKEGYREHYAGEEKTSLILDFAFFAFASYYRCVLLWGGVHIQCKPQCFMVSSLSFESN